MPGASHPGSPVGLAFFIEEHMRLVMIDNYDSFTFNLVQLFSEFEIEVLVFRNDSTTLEEIGEIGPDWICISPGPKAPLSAGISKAVIAHFGRTVPLLGVCLGMQAINEVFGGRTVRAPIPVHGKTCLITHNGDSIFQGIPSPFRVARYHSLCIETGSDELVPLASASPNVLMGIMHRTLPIFGVQFHPESFLGEYGMEIIGNFLRLRDQFRQPPCLSRPADKFPRVNYFGNTAQEVPA